MGGSGWEGAFGGQGLGIPWQTLGCHVVRCAACSRAGFTPSRSTRRCFWQPLGQCVSATWRLQDLSLFRGEHINNVSFIQRHACSQSTVAFVEFLCCPESVFRFALRCHASTSKDLSTSLSARGRSAVVAIALHSEVDNDAFLQVLSSKARCPPCTRRQLPEKRLGSTFSFDPGSRLIRVPGGIAE